MNQTGSADISIENLSVSYDGGGSGLLALRNVSLHIPRGRIVGIAGESGSGKSTLISSLLRLPDNPATVRGGKLMFGRTDILGLAEEDMRTLRGREVAMVFQDPFTALNPVLSIGQQLIDVQHREQYSRADKWSAAVSAMREVHIQNAAAIMKQYPHQLSGGMLQRVCIAMALLVRPSLLVADEPTTALDAVVEREILLLLRNFRITTGAAILLVSHQLNVLAELCDWLAVMYAGQVVEEGPLRAVLDSPQHPYTRLLLQCDPARLPARTRPLPTIPGVVSRLASEPAGCAFAPRCPVVEPRCSSVAPDARESGAQRVRCHLVKGIDDA